MALNITFELNDSGVNYDYQRIDGGEFTITPNGINATFRMQGYKDEAHRASGKGPAHIYWEPVSGDHTLVTFLYEALKLMPRFRDAVNILSDEWKIIEEEENVGSTESSKTVTEG